MHPVHPMFRRPCRYTKLCTWAKIKWLGNIFQFQVHIHSKAFWKNTQLKSTASYVWIEKINYWELRSNNCHVCPRTLTLKNIFFRKKTFFIFQDRKLKLSASVWNRLSLNLTKFQLNQTTNRKNENNNCLNKLSELKFCEVSWNSISSRCLKFQLSILKNKKV